MLNCTFLPWLSRVNCGGLKHANVQSLHCMYHVSHSREILVSEDSSPTYLMNTVTFYYFLLEKVERDDSLRKSA